MESGKRGGDRSPNATTRRHNCEADTNKQLVSHDWRGEEIVTTFRCKRCRRTWEEAKNGDQVLADMQARHSENLRDQVAEIVRRHSR